MGTTPGDGDDCAAMEKRKDDKYRQDQVKDDPQFAPFIAEFYKPLEYGFAQDPSYAPKSE